MNADDHNIISFSWRKREYSIFYVCVKFQRSLIKIVFGGVG